MKNLMKITTLILVLTAFFACEKERNRGSMVVDMTDAPGDYIEVNVDVLEVRAHYENQSNGQNGWVTLATDTGIYDLLDLQNNVTATIASNTSMPLGHVNQMRLILGERNTVMTKDSIVHDLNLSSQDKTGLKMNVNTDITANNTVEIVLDFEADASVIKQGNGEYRLKPVIKVKSVTVM